MFYILPAHTIKKKHLKIHFEAKRVKNRKILTFSVYWLLHAQFYALFGMNHWEWIPFCGSQPLSWVVTIKLHSKLTFGGQKEGVNICIFTFLMLWPQNAHFLAIIVLDQNWWLFSWHASTFYDSWNLSNNIGKPIFAQKFDLNRSIFSMLIFSKYHFLANWGIYQYGVVHFIGLYWVTTTKNWGQIFKHMVDHIAI